MRGCTLCAEYEAAAKKPGIDKKILQKSDVITHIPMRGMKESLNDEEKRFARQIINENVEE
jgi:hypothetical protein